MKLFKLIRTNALGANRRLAKKRVQCLNEALCFESSSVLADSFVLRNPARTPSVGTLALIIKKIRRTLIDDWKS